MFWLTKKMSNSHFDEKSGVICHKTDFGQWYQTVDEVMILVNLESGTRGKDVHVDIQPNKLKCLVRGKIIFEASTISRIDRSPCRADYCTSQYS